MTEGTTRAYQEGQRWAQEKRDRIEARLNELLGTYERQKEIMALPDASLVAGIERWYSAAEAARFFGRTNQWIYDRLRKGKFRYKDGEEIKAIRFVVGKNAETGEDILGPNRFTLPLIREVALSCYRDGTVKEDELKVILRRVVMAEYGEVLFDPDDE